MSSDEEWRPLPFDQLVEEQRHFRFNRRSPLRAAEDSAEVDEILQATPETSQFFGDLLRTRQDKPAANELWLTWGMSLDRLDDSRDLLFERFYEWSVVSATTAVEVFVRGLLKYHVRTQLFRGNVALGEELLARSMDENGFRSLMPKMIKAGWNVDLARDGEWKDFLKLVRGRDKIVHRGMESDDKSALIAILTCSRVIRRIAELVVHHPQLEQLGAFLSSLVTDSLDDLDSDLAVAAEHILRKRPSAE